MKYINKTNGIEIEFDINELIELERIANRDDTDHAFFASTDRLSKLAKDIIKILKKEL